MCHVLFVIAPKASAEGACIWTEVGYCRACMLGYYELCMKGYYEEWVTVVYGSYEQVANLGAVVTLFKAVAYCWSYL